MHYEAPKLISMDEVVETTSCGTGTQAAAGDCKYGWCANAGTCGFGCHAVYKISSNWGDNEPSTHLY